MNNNAVVLLSGGLDSATALAIAQHRDNRDCYCLSLRYGQRHDVELACARRIAADAHVARHHIADIDLSAFGGSALTDPNISVPEHDAATDIDTDTIPVTYVPARNTIFLAHALAYAEVVDAGHIYLGVNALDYSGYPDCRPEYLDAFQAMANLATRRTVQGGSVTIQAPLVAMSKAQIIATGTELGVDYSLTHSCYQPGTDMRACGRCDSCLLRAKGFADAGRPDPALSR